MATEPAAAPVYGQGRYRTLYACGIASIAGEANGARTRTAYTKMPVPVPTTTPINCGRRSSPDKG